MKQNSEHITIAALDIGSSQIKLGVFCPKLSNRIILIGSHKNQLSFGASGEVKSSYSETKEEVFDLFGHLGDFLNKNKIEKLFITIGGHVSSLLEWDKKNNTPLSDLFPIWLDSTPTAIMSEFIKLTGSKKSKDVIGSFLPPGTNWLLAKLMKEKANGFNRESVFLQIGDAIFQELTGACLTDFSSQVSLVHQTEKEYAGKFIEYLGLNKNQLPEINSEPVQLNKGMRKQFAFPAETFAFPAQADFYASFSGLRLKDNEAFVLANTSELGGIYTHNLPSYSERFVNVSLNDGFVQYGSTNTGGNIINWFFENILKIPVNQESIGKLTEQAASINPDECPIFLPYIEGERAPFWNNQISASFIGIKSFHTQAHLFRSLLESVAFARKQLFEAMRNSKYRLIKMGGGSTQNSLWNEIRASVLNKQILISDEKELAIIGLIDQAIDKISIISQLEKPHVGYKKVEPDSDLINIFDTKYSNFLTLQKQLNITYE